MTAPSNPAEVGALDDAAARFEHGVTAQTQNYLFKHSPSHGWLFQCPEWLNLSDILRGVLAPPLPSWSR